MADVFISYKREDRAWAERISRALEASGITCWWDTSLVAGEHFNEAINRELKTSRCVVVVWLNAAHASRWVRAEASHGYDRDILVPASIDGVALDVPFSNLQTVRIDSGDLSALVRGIQAKLSSPVKSVRNQRAPGSISIVPSAVCFALSAIGMVGGLAIGTAVGGFIALAGLLLNAAGVILLMAALSRRFGWTILFARNWAGYGWAAVTVVITMTAFVVVMLGSLHVDVPVFVLPLFMIALSALTAAAVGWLARKR